MRSVGELGINSPRQPGLVFKELSGISPGLPSQELALPGQGTVDDDEVFGCLGMAVHGLGVQDAAFRELFEFLQDIGVRGIAQAFPVPVPKGQVIRVDEGVVPVPFVLGPVFILTFQTIQVIRFGVHGGYRVYWDQSWPVRVIVTKSHLLFSFDFPCKIGVVAMLEVSYEERQLVSWGTSYNALFKFNAPFMKALRVVVPEGIIE